MLGTDWQTRGTPSNEGIWLNGKADNEVSGGLDVDCSALEFSTSDGWLTGQNDIHPARVASSTLAMPSLRISSASHELPKLEFVYQIHQNIVSMDWSLQCSPKETLRVLHRAFYSFLIGFTILSSSEILSVAISPKQNTESQLHSRGR